MIETVLSFIDALALRLLVWLIPNWWQYPKEGEDW